MDDKHLHIVCLDAPSPPDYGGAIDMYYKIKGLAALGYRIHLHYFQYKSGRGHAGLEPYIETAHTYHREPLWKGLLQPLPLIVQSRKNKELLKRLQKDEYPVLFEGLHGAATALALPEKRVWIRMHNDEAAYYAGLARSAKGWRALYFRLEAGRLVRFQKSFALHRRCIAISAAEAEGMVKNWGWEVAGVVRPFLPFDAVVSKTGTGEFALYHGNLDIPENREAVKALLQIWHRRPLPPLIIAGKYTGTEIPFPLPDNVVWEPNPSAERLQTLLQDAHLHLLPALVDAGVKLKLLYALFSGRHVLTTHEAAAGLDPLPEPLGVKKLGDPFEEELLALFQKPFTYEDLALRRKTLHLYSMNANSLKLHKLLQRVKVD